MDNFRYSICEPLNPVIIEKGAIEKDTIIDVFSGFPWVSYLEQVKASKSDAVYYSPSLEFENRANRNGLSISAVGEPGNYEFYIFFKRPKPQKLFFGLISRVNDNFLSELNGQSRKDVILYLTALCENNLSFLEQKFK